MLLKTEDFFHLKLRLHNEWRFFNPNIENVYAINTFDDGNESYEQYNNEWFIIGEWKEKVCLLNREKKIIVYSISTWKLTKIDFIYTNEVMIQTKNLFSTLPDELKNNEFQTIEFLISKYINNHCRHNIVNDYIDLTPDKSHPIKYCDICFTEFE